MFAPGQTILLGVSGGRDSLVLLDVMANLAENLSIKLGVIHVDHGLRRESGQDAAFVLEVARHYGIGARVHEVKIKRKRSSPEEAARQARYEAFERELARSGAERLATGHTADDRVETLLMRVIAGAGPSGLAAIVPVRHPYVRPLLEIWRSDVDSYLPFLPFEPREDPSNLDLSIPRNRVRHSLLPLLEKEYNPSIKTALLREAKLLSSFNAVMGPMVEEARDQCVVPSDNGYELDSRTLREKPLAVQRQLIMDVLVDLGMDPDFGMIEDLRELLQARENPSLVLSRQVRAHKLYDKVIVGRRPAASGRQAASERWAIPAEGLYYLEGTPMRLRISEKPYRGEDPRALGSEKTCILVDAARLPFPLVVRRIRPGDRFHPLGSDGRIVWLLGLRMDDGFKVTSATRRVMEIELERT
jgi:tRNA(Ile)-lysidine synthase